MNDIVKEGSSLLQRFVGGREMVRRVDIARIVQSITLGV
jgi:hypothetical protein